MSYWTSKQKILFVDIDLHLIKDLLLHGNNREKKKGLVISKPY